MNLANKKETAIHGEQQSKTVIVDEIIKIISNYNLSIEDANKTLMQTSKRINQQIVQLPQ